MRVVPHDFAKRIDPVDLEQAALAKTRDRSEPKLRAACRQINHRAFAATADKLERAFEA